MNTQPECPECEKLSKVSEESNKIARFLNWLQDKKDYDICEYSGNDWAGYFNPVDLSTEQLLAEYFEIDLNKVEDERRALLDWIRSEQA